MSMSCADAGTEPVRRFEIFTGAGRRRIWSDEAKAVIVAESLAGIETVCAVARRHGLNHSQLFTWRRQLRRAAGSGPAPAPAAMFVPTVIEASLMPDAPPPPRSRRSCATGPAIELEIDGVAVRIAHGADAGTIGAVIAALKAAR